MNTKFQEPNHKNPNKNSQKAKAPRKKLFLFGFWNLEFGVFKMMPTNLFRLTVVALYIVCAGCFVTKHGTTPVSSLPATAFHPFGRSIINEQHNLELINSACQVGFSFEGTTFRMQLSLPSWLHHNYLQYELDGVYQKRIRIDSTSKDSLVITAPSAGKHTIWIYKATEPYAGVIIHSVSALNVNALQRPAAPLIEFIGNSITLRGSRRCIGSALR
jgi:hypothetical protein